MAAGEFEFFLSGRTRKSTPAGRKSRQSGFCRALLPQQFVESDGADVCRINQLNVIKYFVFGRHRQLFLLEADFAFFAFGQTDYVGAVAQQNEQGDGRIKDGISRLYQKESINRRGDCRGDG